jgi:hypothetical protein
LRIRTHRHSDSITIKHSPIQSLSLTYFTVPPTFSLPIGRILSHTLLLITLSDTPLRFTEILALTPPALHTLTLPSPLHTHSVPWALETKGRRVYEAQFSASRENSSARDALLALAAVGDVHGASAVWMIQQPSGERNFIQYNVLHGNTLYCIVTRTHSDALHTMHCTAMCHTESHA